MPNKASTVLKSRRPARRLQVIETYVTDDPAFGIWHDRNAINQVR